jgi:hypothetical protein
VYVIYNFISYYIHFNIPIYKTKILNGVYKLKSKLITKIKHQNTRLTKVKPISLLLCSSFESNKKMEKMVAKVACASARSSFQRIVETLKKDKGIVGGLFFNR